MPGQSGAIIILRIRKRRKRMSKFFKLVQIALLAVFFGSACIIAIGVISAVAESSGLSGVYLYAVSSFAISFLLFLLFLTASGLSA
jgi:hypothetical protein